MRHSPDGDMSAEVIPERGVRVKVGSTDAMLVERLSICPSGSLLRNELCCRGRIFKVVGRVTKI